ncbi:hypothetical protein X798_02976 [Onchocerca flexuosa]|uniref:Probable ATP-dependent RNA helicase DDX46 n=1 Tax=Onchocerca flexuosa TaxID=387005 RepID=A0A238BYT1_9BILA|nr:hypothetical protein X798_02976 [Onchocerca flexuosa]
MGSHEKNSSRSSRDKNELKRHRSPKREKIRRNRSRSPRDKRAKDRSRSPRKRDRSRSRDRSDRDGKKDKKKDKDLDLGEIVAMTDKNEAERKLEVEMQKRRERIEKWRLERKKGVVTTSEESTSKIEEQQQQEKKWTLDNEEEDEESTPQDIEKKELEDDDEIDPLDAFMSEVNKEVRASKYGLEQSNEGKVRIVVIKSDTNLEPKKGEIIEAEDEIEDFIVMANTIIIFFFFLKVYYRPFRKNFYVETAELAKITKKEIDEYREELDIRVRGRNCPKPVRSWAQCGVEWKILSTLKKLGYKKPTPIQSQAIPAIISGRDVIGIAKTGSGKTLAFLLPMFRHILDQPELEEMDGPIAIIMSPTRELAMQTWKEANKFAKQLDIRVACVYGGVGISDQIGDLKRGAEVVVCTVGRLTDMLAANKGKVTNLRRVTYLVLDEADRMFDMGFEPQVMKIVNNIRPDRQTVLFSATFPRQMEALARKILDKPIEIMVGGKSVVCDDVNQSVVILEEHQKMLKLLELLGVYWENGNVLVFVDKQEKADDLVAQLMRSGYNCAPLHGGIDQFDRDSTILDYKAGKIKLLVATSVAARGLDIKKLILVVNYDCPNHYEDYVHRVGRTGRAGNKGYAYTFILPTGQERMAGEVCRAFETAGKEPPESLKKMWEEYKTHMAAEGKTIHIGGCGFSGSGYKYDQAEDEKEATRRKVTRLMHGMENAVDDDDDDEIEQQLSSMMKGRRRIVEGHTFGGTTSGSGVAGDKLEKARAMAAKIAEAKQLGVTAPVEKDAASLTAEAVMRGSDAVPIALSAKSIAKQKAEQLNERLNYIPSELIPGVETETELQYFEEEIEINDFPQQIRYKICSRDSLAQVQEYADVGISVKGSYYPGNKEPKDGERKLFLFLEARSELALRRAREEILRIMKDTVRQMAQTGARNASTTGRYKVF